MREGMVCKPSIGLNPLWEVQKRVERGDKTIPRGLVKKLLKLMDRDYTAYQKLCDKMQAVLDKATP